MRRLAWLPLVCLFSGFIAGCGPNEERAEDPSSSASSARADETDVDQYVLDEFLVAIRFRPHDIAAAPLVAALPADEFFGSLSERLGIDARQIERLLVLLGPPAENESNHADMRPPRLAVVVQVPIPVVRDQVVGAVYRMPLWGGSPISPDLAEHDGKSYYVPPRLGRNSRSSQPFLYISDDRKTLLFVDSNELMRRLLDPPAEKTELAQKLSAAGEGDVVFAALTPTVESREQMLSLAQSMMPADIHVNDRGEIDVSQPPLPPQATALLENATALRGALNLEGNTLLSLTVEAPDAEAARNVTQSISQALFAGKTAIEMATPALAKALAEQPDHIDATTDKIEEMADHFFDGAVIGSHENKVALSVARPGFFKELPTLIGQVIAAKTPPPEFARLSAMGRIGMAMLSHELAKLRFPYDIRDKEGKPLLSWRVRALPYMDEMELYEKFHLDEPWDSPHNKALIAEMPDVFATPGVEQAGKTSVMVFVGDEAPFGGRNSRGGLGRAEIDDGLSKTIAAIEAGADKAVTWTRPSDIAFNSEDPLGALGTPTIAGFPVVMFDGSAQILPSTIAPDTLKALITPAGGEAIDEDDSKP
jgi:hypothetical protein